MNGRKAAAVIAAGVVLALGGVACGDEGTVRPGVEEEDGVGQDDLRDEEEPLNDEDESPLTTPEP